MSGHVFFLRDRVGYICMHLTAVCLLFAVLGGRTLQQLEWGDPNPRPQHTKRGGSVSRHYYPPTAFLHFSGRVNYACGMSCTMLPSSVLKRCRHVGWACLRARVSDLPSELGLSSLGLTAWRTKPRARARPRADWGAPGAKQNAPAGTVASSRPRQRSLHAARVP